MLAEQGEDVQVKRHALPEQRDVIAEGREDAFLHRDVARGRRDGLPGERHVASEVPDALGEGREVPKEKLDAMPESRGPLLVLRPPSDKR